MTKLAIGTGMGGAAARSLTCVTMGAAIRAGIGAIPGPENRPSCSPSPRRRSLVEPSARCPANPLLRCTRGASARSWVERFAFPPPRELALAVFPLAFATFSLMARGTKPYLSVPEFVNIESLPMLPNFHDLSPSFSSPSPGSRWRTLDYPLTLCN